MARHHQAVHPDIGALVQGVEQAEDRRRVDTLGAGVLRGGELGMTRP